MFTYVSWYQVRFSIYYLSTNFSCYFFFCLLIVESTLVLSFYSDFCCFKSQTIYNRQFYGFFIHIFLFFFLSFRFFFSFTWIKMIQRQQIFHFYHFTKSKNNKKKKYVKSSFKLLKQNALGMKLSWVLHWNNLFHRLYPFHAYQLHIISEWIKEWRKKKKKKNLNEMKWKSKTTM